MKDPKLAALTSGRKETISGLISATAWKLQILKCAERG